jgi:3-hydroxybutyryl-CoA dehydrogenase
MCTTRKIGIIGGGKMASNIVEYLIQYDLSIIWHIRSETVLDDKKNRIKKKISRLLQVSAGDQEQMSRKQDCVTFTSNLADIRSADIIIECISENIESKREVFNALQGTSALVLSNTSSLPLDSFVPAALQSQSAGLHFFYPVQLKQFVELNVFEKTDPGVLDTMAKFVRSIDKQALVLTEEHHFVLNRIFLTYLAQSCHAVQIYNIAFDRFDNEIEKSLFPIGPFSFMKSVGIDVMSVSVEMYSRNSSNTAFFTSMQQLLQNVKVTGNWVNADVSVTDNNELATRAAFEVKSVFVNTVYHELASKYTDQTILIDAIADYVGMTRDAVENLLHEVTPILLESLRGLYNATYWNVYRPSMLMLKNMKIQGHGI